MTRLIDADKFFRTFPELAIEPYINAPTVELFCSYLSDEEVKQPCVESPCNMEEPAT